MKLTIDISDDAYADLRNLRQEFIAKNPDCKDWPEKQCVAALAGSLVELWCKKDKAPKTTETTIAA